MYRAAQFREDRPEVLATAIGDLRLATLITLSDKQLVASHIPMILKCNGHTRRLEGHVARANPQWKQIDSAVEPLAIFLGPHSYISPTWYASKAENQRVVPTWNYISVQAAGPVAVIEDQEWLLQHLKDLTDHNEATQAEPWTVDDAPAEFVQQLCGAIVGVSLTIRSLEGVWKMAQHKSEADRAGVIQGLTTMTDPQSQMVASEMARLEADRSN